MSEEQKKETEKQPNEQEQYEKEFDKVANGEPKKEEVQKVKPEEKKQPELPLEGAEEKKEELKEETPKEAPKEKEHSGSEEEPKEEKSKEHGGVKSLEKALKDTQKYASGLSQKVKDARDKNAELKKQLEEQVSKGASQNTDPDTVISDEAQKKINEDYPDLKPVLDPLIKANKALSKQIAENKKAMSESRAKETDVDDKEDAKKEALEHYNNIVKPAIEIAHPGSSKLIGPKLFDWLKDQSLGMITASNSRDPRDTIMVIAAYKKHLAEKGGKKSTSETDASLPSSSGSVSSPPFGTKDNVGNYDDEFEKAVGNLSKQT